MENGPGLAPIVRCRLHRRPRPRSGLTNVTAVAQRWPRQVLESCPNCIRTMPTPPVRPEPAIALLDWR